MENIDENENFDDDLISTKRYMTFVTEIRPIQELIKEKHVLQYAIVLNKRNCNGKER